MAIRLFSVYYPLNDRITLIKHGLLPLLDQLDHPVINYFLSTYKGENITVMIDSRFSFTNKIIQSHFDKFFDKHGVENPKINLPTDRLFLNFEPNTLQFWEHNPFRMGERELNAIEIDSKSSSLSNICLQILAKIDEWDKHASFEIYLDLLFGLLYYLGVKSNASKECLYQLYRDLKTKLFRQEKLFTEMFAKGRGIFDHNRNSILQQFERLTISLKSEQTESTMAGGWIALFKDLNVHQGKEYSNNTLIDIVSTILSSIQKIDLDPSGLIMALGVAHSIVEQEHIV